MWHFVLIMLGGGYNYIQRRFDCDSTALAQSTTFATSVGTAAQINK